MRWIYRVKLPDAAASEAAVPAIGDAVRKALPDAGWEIRSRGNASPQLERNINRFTQFLTLVGLAALLVGGVGVANAVKSHLDRKRDVIATLKALGATGDGVFAIYLAQIVMLALIGSLIGLAFGAALPFVVVGVLRQHPAAADPARACTPSDLALSLVYGLLTALAFALWPLGRVHDVPVSTLFRETTRNRVALAAPALSDDDGRRDRAVDRGRRRPCLRPASRADLRRLRRRRCSCCCG